MVSSLSTILHRLWDNVMGARLSYPEGIDLNGKVAIVTGGNNGIGYETTKAFSFMGAHTIIACRSEERAREVSDRQYRVKVVQL